MVAVASLGIDGRKVAGSNYGSWIDLAALGGHATGDERFRVFSTTTNGGYGYSGTSMAAPQISRIAALAVAAFGVQRPGSPARNCGNTVGSGRKQFTETINPEYAGMLGNGLVDAEYVLFYDTRLIRSTNVRLRFRDTAPMRNCRGVFRDAIWSVRSHHSTFTSTPGHFRPLRSTTFLLRPSEYTFASGWPR